MLRVKKIFEIRSKIMPLNYPPLGYTGELPQKYNCTVKETLVRAATASEVATGTRTDIYVAPATLSSGVALDFASPSPIGSTTPNTGAFTTLSSTGATTLATTGASTNTIGNNTGATSLALKAGTGGLSLSAAGAVSMVPSTSSGSSTSPTLNARVGSATVTGLTTAAAASVVFTITNSVVTATSVVFTSVTTLGTNDAELTVTRTQVASNTLTITCINNGAAAVNGNVIVNFWVIA
jgi:hypothetical protein